MMRTNTCGELRLEHVGQTVTLSCWVHNRRDFGGLMFVDIRDRYGITQLVFKEPFQLRNEFVIKIEGVVDARPTEMLNKEMETGEIEVNVLNCEILSEAEILPFEISNEEKVSQTNEALRLEYRFLDLRRPKLQAMLKTKADFFHYLRCYFREQGFMEVQTPILANSSPEGARDFLIPSRLHPHKFYALPQAPQQFKQLLMVSGVDRYFQIAPCFRDEDTRLDRHYGEFYQLDMEMSFAGQDDVFAVMEPLMKQLTEKFSSKKLVNLAEDGSFKRIPWRDALRRYGSDKPDLRYGLEISDVSDIFSNTEFPGFAEALKMKGAVMALKVDNAAQFSRKIIDELKELTTRKKINVFATMTIEDDGVKSSLIKFIDEATLRHVAEQTNAKVGDLIIFSAGPWRAACKALGLVRQDCAKRLELVKNSEAAYCWITDFPMYDLSEIKEGEIDFGHNPFSMPQGGAEALDSIDPLEILAYQYDLVLNGFEVSSGAVRNHEPELLYKVFAIAGYEASEVDRRFGAMVKAFRFGAPPHAGNAPGIDRLLMVLNDWDSIRDIYAFPKDGQGRDLLMGSPGEVDTAQLDELNLVFKK